VSSHQQQSDKPLTPRHAWQPLTPRGVAAFATSTLTRLVLVQLVFALITAVAVLGFLRLAWFPVIEEAIQRLPDTGAIRQGELAFAGESPKRLAENAHLAIVMDVNQTANAGRTGDIEVTFEKNRVAICGALGCWHQAYDRRYTVSFNRPELAPAWGAWQWPAVALITLATVASLLVMWWSAALVYLPLVKSIAFFKDRAVTWRGAWRLSAAALLPGALIVTAGIILYGFGAVDLFRLGLLYILHIIAGLVFVVTSPSFLPAIAGAKGGKNPFGSGRTQAQKRAGKKSNPFSRS
jgi:hypothetical protein